jgi:putative transcriptional regulator
MDDFHSLAGRLLVAMPGISDPRFEHAVILVCAHRPDHAMGLRLDRPAPGVDLKAVLTKLETPAPESAADRAVLVGGPVERERGFVLHTDDWLVEDASLAFGDGLAMTGTREALAAMVDPAGPRRAVLLLGYAGLGRGPAGGRAGRERLAHRRGRYRPDLRPGLPGQMEQGPGRPGRRSGAAVGAERAGLGREGRVRPFADTFFASGIGGMLLSVAGETPA